MTNFGFLLQAIWALAVVALVLLGLTYAVRTLNRGRIVAGTSRRLITVVESAAVSQHSAIHVVKIGDRYIVIGGGSAGVTHIADVPADVVEPYIETQRKALGEQRDAVLRLLHTIRKRS